MTDPVDSTWSANVGCNNNKKTTDKNNSPGSRRRHPGQDGDEAIPRHSALLISRDNGCSKQQERQHSSNVKTPQGPFPQHVPSSKALVDHEEKKSKLSKKFHTGATFPKHVPISTGRETFQKESKKEMGYNEKVSNDQSFPTHVPSSTNRERNVATRKTWIDGTGGDKHVTRRLKDENHGGQSTSEALPSLKPPSRLYHKRIEKQLTAEMTKGESMVGRSVNDETGGVAAMPSIVPPEYPDSWKRNEDNVEKEHYAAKSLMEDPLFSPNVASTNHAHDGRDKKKGGKLKKHDHLHKRQRRRSSALDQEEISMESRLFPEEEDEAVARRNSNQDTSSSAEQEGLEPGAVSMSSNGPRALRKGRLTVLQDDETGSQAEYNEEAIVSRASERASPNKEKSRTWWCCKNRFQMIITGIILLITVVVAVAVPLVMIYQKDNAPVPQTPTPLPTLAPTPAPSFQSTSALIQANALDGGISLNDPSSTQYRALQWLLGNSKLSTYSDRRKLQRYSLATLYFSTNGTGWTRSTDWLTDSHECTWYFDRKACSDGEFVSNLDLNNNRAGNNLVGTLPRELALLSSSLVVLYMNGNDLSSPIPSELVLLTNLEGLHLWNNKLTGTIPSKLSGMTNLKGLHLRDNKLTGTIPSEISEMTNLDALHLYNNNLSPPFTCPSFIGGCFVRCGHSSRRCRQL